MLYSHPSLHINMLRGTNPLVFLYISTVALKGTFSSSDGWHLLLCSGVLEAKEQGDYDISNVPMALWDAGYYHPDKVAKGLDSNALAVLIKLPPCLADRILSICERYSSELELQFIMHGIIMSGFAYVVCLSARRKVASLNRLQELALPLCCRSADTW